MCLAEGHNAVTPVRLESATPLSRVKHSTTERLRSRIYCCLRSLVASMSGVVLDCVVYVVGLESQCKG